MKNLYLPLLFLIFLTLTGCEKEDGCFNPEGELSGTWELKTTTNGWTGTIEHPAGNGNLIKFTGNTYERTRDGQKEVGKYKLEEGVSMLTNSPVTFIFFYQDEAELHQNDSLRLYIETDGNTLTIAMDAYDAGALIYRRISSDTDNR
ncbi:hypothetical protein [Pontibacter anaerobius]|uniref:Lipocalin-like domain-containing protein n=1 Tax=Pontibacter anaerobius TaxID=2993940 RepID=A0ABT3RAX1_9BACT|nr:hypothetical protein [Pontibacter anaerobius]MCX2738660.1 hypothetical protein [Pontibacter anaerobius]